MTKTIIIISLMFVAVIWAFKGGKTSGEYKHTKKYLRTLKRAKKARERRIENEKEAKTIRDKFTRPDA